MKDRATPSAHEDYPLSAVPDSEKKGFLSLSMVLLGFTFYTGTMWAGGTLGVAYPITQLVTVVIIGSVLLAAYGGALSVIAQRSGLSTVLMSRFAFGDYGSKGTDVLLGLTQLGWYAWGTAMIAVVLAQLTGTPQLTAVYTIIAGIGFCWTAYIGYRGLEWLARLSVPAMAILIVWSLTLATGDAGGVGALSEIAPTESLGFSAALTIVFGTFAAGATQITNWTRYSRSGSAALWAAFLALAFGNGLMIFSGAYTSYVYQVFDLVEVMALQGILLAGILLLLLNIWTTQDNTIYNFSIATTNFVRTDRRSYSVVFGALFSTVIALMGFYHQFEPFLIALGTYIPPIGGVIMGDFVFRHRGRYPALDTATAKFNWVGIAAYGLGVAAALRAPGIAPINGIMGAIAFYGLLNVVDGAIFRRPPTAAPPSPRPVNPA